MVQLSQCRTAVLHCCKGHAASQWEMAILGCQNSVTPNWSTKNLTHVITSVSWPRTPNLIKFGGTRASRQYGEMYTSRIFLKYFFTGDFLSASTEINTQQFQALNGLKCSTVGNLGSLWAFIVMLLRFTHFFRAQSQKRSKFSDLEKLRPRNALHWKFWE